MKIDTPNWWSDAQCRGKSKMFFSERRADIATAKAICGGCPVASECLADNLALPLGITEDFGIVAGTTPRDRVRLRRKTCTETVVRLTA